MTWVEHNTYERDELAVRFHHQLVAIHSFPNGNGRHSRICADYLVRALDGQRFTWGARSIASTEEIRHSNLAALHLAEADADFTDLVTFARS